MSVERQTINTDKLRQGRELEYKTKPILRLEAKTKTNWERDSKPNYRKPHHSEVYRWANKPTAKTYETHYKIQLLIQKLCTNKMVKVTNTNKIKQESSMSRPVKTLPNALIEIKSLSLLEAMAQAFIRRFNDSLTDAGKPRGYAVSYLSVAKAYYQFDSFSTEILMSVPRHMVLAKSRRNSLSNQPISKDTAQRLMLAISYMNEKFIEVSNRNKH